MSEAQERARIRAQIKAGREKLDRFERQLDESEPDASKKIARKKAAAPSETQEKTERPEKIDPAAGLRWSPQGGWMVKVSRDWNVFGQHCEIWIPDGYPNLAIQWAADAIREHRLTAFVSSIQGPDAEIHKLVHSAALSVEKSERFTS
jgi:hypothetical protein